MALQVDRGAGEGGDARAQPAALGEYPLHNNTFLLAQNLRSESHAEKENLLLKQIIVAASAISGEAGPLVRRARSIICPLGSEAGEEKVA